MVSNENKSKISVYGTNFFTPSLIGALQNIPGISEAVAEIPRSGVVLDKIADSANPYGAMLFGAIDILGAVSPKIKNSKFTRFAHFGGFVTYGARFVLDSLSVAKGDYESLVNLAWDASMVYQLGKDTFRNYAAPKDFWDDLTKW